MSKNNPFKKVVTELGMKNDCIAKLLKVSSGTVYSYSTGRRKAPAKCIEFLQQVVSEIQAVNYEG